MPGHCRGPYVRVSGRALCRLWESFVRCRDLPTLAPVQIRPGQFEPFVDVFTFGAGLWTNIFDNHGDLPGENIVGWLTNGEMSQGKIVVKVGDLWFVNAIRSGSRGILGVVWVWTLGPIYLLFRLVMLQEKFF